MNQNTETQLVGIRPSGSVVAGAKPMHTAERQDETKLVSAGHRAGENNHLPPLQDKKGTLYLGRVASPEKAKTGDSGETRLVGRPSATTIPVQPKTGDSGETCLVGRSSATIPAQTQTADSGETRLVRQASATTAAQPNPAAIQPGICGPVPAILPEQQADTGKELTAAPLPNGTILNEKFEIIDSMGQGGFGITYRAKHQILNDERIIKECFPTHFVGRGADGLSVILRNESDADIVELLQSAFIHEAQTIARLAAEKLNPNIIHVSDFFRHNGTAYYVMRRIHGTGLDKLIEQKKSLSEQELENLLIQLLNGLDAIHDKGIVHLDIKPANILVEKDGTPVLIDFGAADGHKTGALQGSPGYAPPEQMTAGAQADIGPASDIYALGATFYHLLTGARPTETPAPLQLRDRSELRCPDVYRAFLAGIDKAMQPSPKDRWESAAAWRKLILDMQEAEKKAIAAHRGE